MNGKKRKELKGRIRMTHCRYCLSKENLTLDHKVPIVQGGTNDKKNLQCLCRRCNMMKSGLSDKEVKHLFRWHLAILVSREMNR